jgi:hypothetical protein
MKHRLFPRVQDSQPCNKGAIRVAITNLFTIECISVL